jgi:low temperature requirement protein LtrA
MTGPNKKAPAKSRGSGSSNASWMELFFDLVNYSKVFRWMS